MPKELIGFTIQDAIPGKVKEPVLNLEDARKYQNMDIWKIDWKTGKFKPRRTSDGVIRATSLWATMKQKEPLEWASFEGVVPPRSEEPDVPGSTKNYPGVFLIVDRGIVEYGFSKGYMLEIFLDEGILKGRYLIRGMGKEELEKALEKEEFQIEDSFFSFEKGEEVLPPSEGDDKSPSPLIFLVIQTKDQTPYVLGEAVTKNLLPPLGFSALPKKIRKKIPKELQYWLEEDRNKALEMRRKILELDIISKSTGTFTLHRRYWLDTEHKTIRYGPSTQIYDLTIRDGDKIIHFSIPENPTDFFGFTGYQTGIDEKILNIKDTRNLEPGTELNPTKSTPATIEYLDGGNCVIYQLDPEFIKIKFNGKELKGLYVGKKETNTQFWEFEPSKTVLNKFIPIVKNEFQGIVTGPVLIPDQVDLQGHMITKEEIEKAMYDFMRYSRNISFMHKDEFINDETFILECAQQKGDYKLPDGRVIKDGTWYLTIQELNPHRKELIKTGKIRGFSIRGVGKLKTIRWEE